MSRKKIQITLPRELRRQVQPWGKTRRIEILTTVKKLKAYEHSVIIAGALLGIGTTTIYRELQKKTWD